MDLFGFGAAFILGALCASFAGVLAGRLNTGSSSLRGRSRCDACGKELGVLDLVPILSWAAGAGRARCCGSRVSPLSTIGEAVLGILFALAYAKIGISYALAAFFLALLFLYALTLYDLAHTVIPPAFLVPFAAFTALYAWLSYGSDPLLYVLGVAAAIGLALFLMYALSGGRAMGVMDGPLAFALALLVGPLAIAGIVFSFWIGAAVGIIMLVRAPQGARMGIEVPFAPFLAAGFLLAYFTQWDPFALILTLEGLS